MAEAKSEDCTGFKQEKNTGQKADFSFNISLEDFSEHKITGSFSLVIITSRQGILSYINELNNILIVCKVCINAVSFKQEFDVSIIILTP